MVPAYMVYMGVQLIGKILLFSSPIHAGYIWRGFYKFLAYWCGIIGRFILALYNLKSWQMSSISMKEVNHADIFKIRKKILCISPVLTFCA